MSQFSKCLGHWPTGKRETKYGIKEVADIMDVNQTLEIHDSLYHEYKIEARLGSKILISDVVRNDPVAFKETMRKMRCQLVDIMFGEFREDLRAINLALYRYNVAEAQHLVNQLYEKMFDDGSREDEETKR